MPNLSEISNGTKLLLGAGILLLIDTFLPWQKASAEFGGVEIASVSRSGWSGIGVVMGLALILLLAWVVIQVLNVKLNFDLPITEAWLTLGLGIAVLALAAIKLVTILGEASTIWSYIGVALAALVAYGAWMRAQELGGIGAPATATAGTTMGVGDEPASTSADTDMAPPPRTGTGTPAAPAEPATPSAPMEPGTPATTAAPVQPRTPAAPSPPPQAAPPMTPADPLGTPTEPDEPLDTTPETRDDDEMPPETRSTL